MEGKKKGKRAGIEASLEIWQRYEKISGSDLHSLEFDSSPARVSLIIISRF